MNQAYALNACFISMEKGKLTFTGRFKMTIKYISVYMRTRIRFIFFLCALAISTIVCAQSADWIRTEYSIKGVAPDNQIKNISKDKNGFFWLLTGSGYAIRWNGNLFFNEHLASRELTQETRFWCFLNSPDNDIYMMTLKKQEHNVFYVNKDSRIVPWTPASDRFVPPCEMTEGDFAVFPKPGKTNPPAAAYPLAADKAGCTYGQYIRQAGPDAWYLFNEQRVVYIEQGYIKDTISYADPSRKGFVLDGHLVLFTPRGYDLYLRGKKIHSGNGGPAIFPGVRRMDYRASGSHSYVLLDGVICRLALKGTELVKQEIISLVEKNTAPQAINGFYVDETANRILVAYTSGGLTVYRRNYFRSGPFSNPAVSSPYYTLAMYNGQILSNTLLLQKIYGNVILDYDQVGPVIPASGKIYFANANTCYEFNTDKSLIRKVPFSGTGLVRSGLLRNENEMIFTDGKLKLYSSASQKVIEPALPGNPEDLKTVTFISAYGTDSFFAAGKSAIWLMSKHNFGGRQLQVFPFPNPVIRGMNYSESLQVLFIAINDKGVFALERKTGRMVQLPAAGAPELNSCHYVLEDKQGDFWLPTNFGLFLLMRGEMIRVLADPGARIQYHRFGLADGLMNEEFNGGFGNSGILSGDSLILSNMYSYVSFNTATVKNNLIGNSDGRLIEGVVWLNDSLLPSLTKHIHAPAGFQKMVFRIDYPDFNKKVGATEFRLLHSRDTSWRILPDNNQAELRDLPGGHYIIEFRVTGLQQIQYLAYDITVARYWYQQWWAYMMYILLFIAAGMLIFKWRANSIRHKSLKLVDESRRELFAIISHDLRSPLSAYQGMSEVIHYLIKTQQYDRIEKVAAQIDSTGAKLDLLMNNLLNWNLLQQEKLVVKTEKLDLAALLQSYVSIYQELAVQKQITIHVEHTGTCEVQEDKDLLSLVIRNLLDNAIKNALAGSRIRISLTREGGVLQLGVYNRYNPVAADKLKMVKSLVESSEAWEAGSKGMGFGLRMVFLAVQKMGGTLQVNIGEEEVGFCITL